MTSFSEKSIRFVFILGKGNFNESGNTKIIEGLACDVTITKPGLPEKNSSSITIYGLSYETMEELTTLSFRPLHSRKNTVSVIAGEKNGIMSQVFSGEITTAYADFNTSPDVKMIIEADTGTYAQQISQSALTIQGEMSIENAFKIFAKDAGLTFKNENIKGNIKNTWLPGSPIQKAEMLARQLGINLFLDDDEMIISSSGTARNGNAVFVTPETGMIGYPTFNNEGISFSTYFNQDLKQNGLVKIESIVPKATGNWRITKLVHSISAYNPAGGEWRSDCEAVFYGK